MPMPLTLPPLFTGMSSRPARQQSPPAQTTQFASNAYITARKPLDADTVSLRHAHPRFGASQGGGTAVDYSSGAYAAGAPGGDDGDDRHYQKPLPVDNSSVDWDAIFRELRALMRQETNRKGKKASTDYVMGSIEEKYGIELPAKVISARHGNNKQEKLNKLLGTIKSGHLKAKNKAIVEDNPKKPITWVPVEEQEYRDPNELPSFIDIASQAGSESHLSTEDRYTLAANYGTAPPNSGNAPVVRSGSPIGWRQSRADNNLWRYHHGNGQYSEWNTREYWDTQGSRSKQK